jgi:histidinol-phosphate/aromatic aminotransferase/cobyric acid decarboxylase-like protein
MANPAATVYSYYAPEIENTVSKALTLLNYSHKPDSIHATLRKNYEPGLDDLHLPLMEKYEAFARSEGVIGLDTFNYKYFTNGSSEGIFHLINAFGPLYQFEGEYQGYKALCDATGRSIQTITLEGSDLDTPYINNVEPGVIILSNPASKDGNIVDPAVLNKILNSEHSVIIDLAYMGMTRKPLNLDLTHPKVLAVVGSLSKPFGLYYYRIGFCYAKIDVPSLYGNKWFKNALSIKIGEAVLDEATPKKMAAFKDKYFDLQERAVEETGRFAHAPGGWIKPSDVWLLAHAQVPTGTWGGPSIAPFKRTDSDLRYCLTPFYMEYQNG